MALRILVSPFGWTSINEAVGIVGKACHPCALALETAFLEVRDGTTETVARAHARLEFDDDLHAYVLFNESSTNPTFIRRDGRNLRVAPRDPRGVRVQPGDELQLGRAILKVTPTDRNS